MNLYTQMEEHEEEYKEALKKGLKRARTETGLTQKELAAATGIHSKTVMNWEQGEAKPKLLALIELSKFYNCDLDYLTGRIDCKTHTAQELVNYIGLPEKTVEKLASLTPEHKKLISDLINHADFCSLMKQLQDLSDKEHIAVNQGALIITQMREKIGGKNISHIDSRFMEKAMLYSASTQITNMLCDVTNTEL